MTAIAAADPKVNCVVSASAGTGKTWLITARLLRLLLSGETPGTILAVTFTKKAADEMRDRLYETLEKWSRLENRALLEEMKTIGASKLVNLPRAQSLYETVLHTQTPPRIVTFHAFCRELLMLFPLEARTVPIGFSLAENDRKMRSKALELLFQEVAQEHSTLKREMDTLFRQCGSLYNAQQGLLDFLHQRNNWQAFCVRDENVDPCRFAIEKLSRSLPEDSPIEMGLSESRKQEFATYAKLLKLSGKTDLAQRAKQIETLTPGYQPEHFDRLYSCFSYASKMGCKPLKVTLKMQKTLGSEASAEVEALHKKCTAWLEEQLEKIQEKRFRERNIAWYRLGSRLVEIYQALKREHDTADFDDLEWGASQLLTQTSNAQYVQAMLNSRISHILVDEFQDTNPLQWALLCPFLEEIAAQHHGSVMLVGDVKQSIYSFRGARPELLKTASQWISEKMDGKCFSQNFSYRSSPSIMDFVNRVFQSETMAHEYPYESHESNLQTPGCVTALPLCQASRKNQEKPWRRILSDPPGANVETPRQKEAMLVAQTIEHIVGKETIHEKDGSTKLLCHEDILVLFRKRTHIKDFETALQSRNIPFIPSGKETLYDSLEASDLLALLEFLTDKENNQSLAQVLRSPVFELSSTALYELSRGKSLFKALLLQEKESTQILVEKLTRWMAMRDKKPVYDLLMSIDSELDFRATYKRASHPQEHALIDERFEALLDFALEHQDGRYSDVSGFCDALRERKSETGSHLSDPISNHAPDLEKHVRLMTIHGAKGLEAPVVFLVDCGPQSRPHQAYRALTAYNENDIYPAHFVFNASTRETVALAESLRESRQKAEKREEKNLLYVALTRARQYLYLSGTEQRKPDSKQNHKQGSSWYSLLAPHATRISKTPTDLILDTSPSTEAAAQERTDRQVPEHDTEEFPAESRHPGSANTPKPLRLPESTQEEQKPEAMLMGKVIHRALELLCEEEACRKQELFKRLLREYPTLQESPENLHAWLDEACTTYHHPKFRELFDPALYSCAYDEMPLLFHHQEKQFYGRLDRVCVSSERAWLVDYKTSSNDNLPEAVESHRPKMFSYWRGCGLLWPDKVVRASLLFTNKNVLYDYAFQEESQAPDRE